MPAGFDSPFSRRAFLRFAAGAAVALSRAPAFAADEKIGTLIAQAQGNFNPDGVYAALVVTTVLALAAEGSITMLERRLLRWRPPRPRAA